MSNSTRRRTEIERRLADVAGNGLIDRRALLGRSMALAGAAGAGFGTSLTRFRMAWRWDGGPAILQSRAWDQAGNVQPTRAQFVAQRGELKRMPPVLAFPNQHFNAVTSWAVDSKGVVKHAYA